MLINLGIVSNKFYHNNFMLYSLFLMIFGNLLKTNRLHRWMPNLLFFKILEKRKQLIFWMEDFGEICTIILYSCYASYFLEGLIIRYSRLKVNCKMNFLHTVYLLNFLCQVFFSYFIVVFWHNNVFYSVSSWWSCYQRIIK